MIHTQKSTILATGLAMFSMFFGAGNVVFPLSLGQIAQDKNFFAILGMLLTAVCVPFIGLIAMTLYKADHKAFFGRIGTIPGFLVAACIMGLIGPFGAMPRCIALSYSTAKIFLPQVSLPLFSLIACMIIFLFTFKRNNVLDLLGFILTPFLIGSLVIIVIMGLWNRPEILPSADYGRFAIFLKGLMDGYKTMDLLGAFFFSSVVVTGLRNDLPEDTPPKKLITISLKASVIGGLLLGMTYVGFSFVSSFHAEALNKIPSDELISMIAVHVLGPYASLVACVAVSFACLTTAIALAVVFAEFLKEDLFVNKIGYIPPLIGTLAITYFVSTLNFTGIAAFLEPILKICYPALIVLTVFNILYIFYGVKIVKIPVLLTFLTSFVAHFWL
jgi:LIVCS family branched-chain amino acid:cation transporter